MTQDNNNSSNKIIDRTNIPKIVESGDYVYYFTPIGNGLVKVIETFTNIVFNVKKNIAVLDNGAKIVNSEDGFKATGYTKWIPELEKFIVIKTSSTNEYQIKRVKNIDIIKKKVILYDGSILEFCKVAPFIGKIL